MQLTKAFFALLATVTLSQAAALRGLSGSEIEARKADTPGGVFLCTDINFSGTCQYFSQPLATCVTLEAPFSASVSSFGPDAGAICYAYREGSCDEAEWTFTYPGDATGGLIGNSDPWNDKITNFMCYAN